MQVVYKPVVITVIVTTTTEAIHIVHLIHIHTGHTTASHLLAHIHIHYLPTIDNRQQMATTHTESTATLIIKVDIHNLHFAITTTVATSKIRTPNQKSQTDLEASSLQVLLWKNFFHSSH